jgi:hypothetical protein
MLAELLGRKVDVVELKVDSKSALAPAKNTVKKRVDPVPEAPTRVGSREGNNRSKVLPLQKFCRETASNPGPGDSAS